MKRLQSIFDKFDVGKRGTLNLPQFINAIGCILGREKASTFNLHSIYLLLTNDDRNELDFDTFCLWIAPEFKQIIDANRFNSEYESVFFQRDLGSELMAGVAGMGAYVKWRYTEVLCCEL